MNKKDLSINTLTLEIKVISVNGQKMTKATFEQIEFISDEDIYIEFDEKGNNIEDCHVVLGYVNITKNEYLTRFLIITDGDCIYKHRGTSIFCKKYIDDLSSKTEEVFIDFYNFSPQLFIST